MLPEPPTDYNMFDDMVIRLGGMHILLTFQAVIGKMFAETGFEDLLVESNVYGSNTVSRIMQGKAYNRGIRAHKLVLEALERLQWRSFVSWSVSNDEKFVQNEDEICELISTCGKTVTNNEKEELLEAFVSLTSIIPPLKEKFDAFKDFQSRISQTFNLWNQYIKIVHIMLKFIRAERIYW